LTANLTATWRAPKVFLENRLQHEDPGFSWLWCHRKFRTVRQRLVSK
jgi:hypothetical protein